MFHSRLKNWLLQFSLLWLDSSKLFQALEHHCKHCFRSSMLQSYYELHWFPMREWVEFKIGCVTFKALRNKQPTYLSDILHSYVPSHSLPSMARNYLDAPSVRTQIATKAFSNLYGSYGYLDLPSIPHAEFRCLSGVSKKSHLFHLICFQFEPSHSCIFPSMNRHYLAFGPNKLYCIALSFQFSKKICVINQCLICIFIMKVKQGYWSRKDTPSHTRISSSKLRLTSSELYQIYWNNQ